jgi:two-component system chemotaxis response regulator CheY
MERIVSDKKKRPIFFKGKVPTDDEEIEEVKVVEDEGPKEDLRPLIYILDHSKTAAQVLTKILERLGFQVQTFFDVEETWSALNENQEKSAVAIFSEIEIKDRSGVELLERVRASENLSHLPFVIITDSNDKEPLIQAAKFRVTGCVLKPSDYEKIRKEIERILPNIVLSPIEAPTG